MSNNYHPFVALRLASMFMTELSKSRIWSALILSVVAGCSQDSGSNASPANDESGPQLASQSCETGTSTNARYYVEREETPFYVAPDKNSDKVINSRASEVLGRTEYRTLWPEMVLQGLCETPQWLQAKIVEADGQPVDWETGWVELSLVKANASSEYNSGLIWNVDGETDFSAEERKLIKEGALKVLRDEPNCLKITTGYWSESRKGQVYVTCTPKNDAEPFNVWFSLDDVKSGRNLAAPTAFDEARSRQLCVDAIRSRVNHPSILDIHTITGYGTRVANNGNREVIQSFSAKNSFGLELEYRARCLVTPSGKLEIAVTEER